MIIISQGSYRDDDDRDGLVAAALVVVLLTLRAPKAVPAPAAVEEPEELRQAA